MRIPLTERCKCPQSQDFLLEVLVYFAKAQRATTLLFYSTKDRETEGSATFEDDDVTYDMMPLKVKTPDFYTYSANAGFVINRQSLAPETDIANYSCEIQNISDLHRAAERYLKMLLNKNKI